jgi:hypothetical protein
MPQSRWRVLVLIKKVRKIQLPYLSHLIVNSSIYVDEILYCKTNDSIRAASLPKTSFDNGGSTVLHETLKIRTINPGLNVLALWHSSSFFVILESPDNQLDCNKLIITDINDDEKFTFKLVQEVEVLP